MKNSIKISLTLLIGLFTIPAFGGALDESIDVAFETKKPKEYIDTDIGFQLMNHYGNPIWIAVMNGSEVVLKPQKVEGYSIIKELRGKNLVQQKLNINKTTSLAIWMRDPGPDAKIRKKWLLMGSAVTVPTADYVYEFTPGKTIYGIFTKDKGFTQEIPALKGAVLSESGFSLQNNITDADITLISTKNQK